jgi:NAD(P)-dependent dehydrogenase (short-subunit alcohol dehydrogenase family)
MSFARTMDSHRYSAVWIGLSVLAGLDMAYCGMALAFLAGWREHPKTIGRPLAFRLVVWGLVFAGLWWLETIRPPAFHDETTILVLVVLLPFAILCVRNVVQVRREIVEGGPAPTILPRQRTSRPRPARVIVVTGANAGIGKETVLWFAKQQQQQLFSAEELSNDDDEIILLCRNTSKGQEVIAEAEKQAMAATGHHQPTRSSIKMRVVACDLTSFQSVRAAVDEIKTSCRCFSPPKNGDDGGRRRNNNIDMCLIQNAGVMLKDCEYTEDGHEMTLQANHLGHFLLTALLLPLIMVVRDDNNNDGADDTNHHDDNNTAATTSPSCRVISLTSSTFPLCHPAQIPYDDPIALDAYLECRRIGTASHQYYPYGLFTQYAKTKWCNILHAYYLFHEYGGGNNNGGGGRLWTAAVHPGLVRTDVVRNMPWYMKLGNDLSGWLITTIQKTPAQGAWGTVHAAQVDDVDADNGGGGCYWENRRIIPLDEDLLRRAAAPIWDWSCDAVRLTKCEREALEQCKRKKQR